MKNGRPGKSRENRLRRHRPGLRRWPAWCLASLLALTVLAAGCKKSASSRPPQPVAANPSPPPPPPSPPPPSMVEVADQRFDRGEYGEAAAAYEGALESNGAATPEVLFRLAVSYALGEQAGAKRGRVVELLRQAIEADPQGMLAGAARVMLALLDENRALQDQSSQKDRKIKQLSDELERLKKIDLRRRPPER